MTPAVAAARAAAALLLLFLAAVPAHGATAPNATDAQLLLDFKAGLSNASGGPVLPSWQEGGDPCDGTWQGISCAARRVIRIELNNTGLQGSIAPGSLPPNLRRLVLNNNAISGPLPELPSKLTLLEVGFNSLTGSLPALPPTLTYLGATRNRMSGRLPAELPQGLEFMDVSGNQLTGPLPSAALPAQLGNAWFGVNQLTGSIPPAWTAGLPEGMGILALDNNDLNGSLPASWDLPTSVSWLYLHNNSFSGTLPTWNGSQASVTVKPGNPGLCGPVSVPSQPQWETFERSVSDWVRLPGGSLPDCSALAASPSPGSQAGYGSGYGGQAPSPSPAAPPAPPEGGGGGGSSSGAIVGGVVGACAAVAAALAVWWWCSRRRRRAGAAGSDAPGSGSSDLKDLERAQGPQDSANGSSTAAWSGKATGGGSSAGGDSAAELLATDALLSCIHSKLAQQEGSAAAGAAGSARAHHAGARPRGMGVDVSVWEIKFEALQLQKQIGEGSFGRVYLGRWNELQVAVKLLLGPAAALANTDAAANMALSLNNPVLANLQEEASMMAALRHPNVLGFLGVCTLPPCVVSEYCPRGSLFDLLKEARDSPSLQRQLTWSRRLCMCLDAAMGMLYLHEGHRTPVVHRDLKSPNLLVNRSWQVKVCDFNLSKIMVEEGSMAASSTAVTNPRWLAPEVLAGSTHTRASDVYAYGVVLWEMLVWELPWQHLTNPWQIAKAVIDGERLQVPPPDQLPGVREPFEALGGYLALMHACWAQDPADRPTFAQIITELKKLLAATSQREAGTPRGGATPPPTPRAAKEVEGLGPATGSPPRQNTPAMASDESGGGDCPATPRAQPEGAPGGSGSGVQTPPRPGQPRPGMPGVSSKSSGASSGQA